jgi:hypothetical protein
VYPSRLPALTILGLILFSSLPFNFITVQGAPGITKVQGPQTPVISASDLPGYSLMAVNDNYKAYFKANSATSKATMIQKNGYQFQLDISTSQLHWYSSTYNAIMGMQKEMNPQNTLINTSGETVTYLGAWSNTNLQYSAGVDTLKETLVIYAVSAPSSTSIIPDYLQYSANCYYDNTLTIVADGVSYLHPTNQRFTTSGEIAFNDPTGKMVFSLPVPYISDSSVNINPAGQFPSNAILGTYAVTANNGVLIINIRIPKSFIDSAVYPVYFDPPVRVQGNARGTGNQVNHIHVTMGAAPTNGNVLIAVIGYGTINSPSTLSSIVQTGVNWSTGGAGSQISIYDPTYTRECVTIWVGIVGESASADIIINFTTDNMRDAVADICEYSGVATSSFLDKTASKMNVNTASPVTETTATTTQADELWIGGIFYTPYTLSTPTNSFTLIDGVKLGYFEKIVSSTNTASTGASATKYYGPGCIATFKAAGGTDYTRAATQSASFASSTTRLFEAARASAQSVTVGSAAAKIAEFARASTQAVTGAFTAAKLTEFSRVSSAAFTLAPNAARILEALRVAAQAVTIGNAATRLTDLLRTATQSITYSSTGLRLIEALRAASQAITVITATQRLSEALRTAAQTVTFTADTLRGIVVSLTASLSVTVAQTATRTLEAIRDAAQALTFTSSSQRLSEFLRDATQAITMANQAVRVFLAGPVTYIRDAAQSITVDSSINLYREVSRIAALTLPFNFSGALGAIEYMVYATVAFAVTRLLGVQVPSGSQITGSGYSDSLFLFIIPITLLLLLIIKRH